MCCYAWRNPGPKLDKLVSARNSTYYKDSERLDCDGEKRITKNSWLIKAGAHDQA